MMQPHRGGAAVPNNFIWDVAQIQDVDVNSREFKELLIRLYQDLGLMAEVLNVKESGYYYLGEFVNSQLWFPNPALTSETATVATYRPNTRLVVIFGALPNTGTKSVAHGLTPNAAWTWTLVQATATNTTTFQGFTLNSAQATLTVDATNVTITTTANLSAYNVCNVVLEYLTL